MSEKEQAPATEAGAAAERGGYRPTEIEPKWQKRWEADGLYEARIDDSRKKLYCLTMLPYPSGDLHMGHWFPMTPSDARARFKSMQGYNVMFPIGFDAFGLPAENAAIKHGKHPREWTYANIERMRGQLRTMGAMWDWKREAVSADPAYYRWTQWFFTKLFEHDLAYKKMSPVDFCPSCNTTLAREQVEGDDRHCERCLTPVIKKDLDQWFFRITNYADELLDFSKIKWPEDIRLRQENWVGRSEGAEVTFSIYGRDETISVFTTRADTLWGVSFMVLAPENPLAKALTTEDRRVEVDGYVGQAVRQTEIQREATDREKTGVFTGAYAVNPVNGRKVPVYVGDYVLMTYGTGAVMGVPAHDTRDFAFARKYEIDIPVVIAGPDWNGQELEEPYLGPGKMVNSGSFDGTPVPEQLSKVVEWLDEQGMGSRKVIYRLRDWLISRQRYWGCPIPMIECGDCGHVAVPEDQLPVLLPDDVEWKPTGESPLKLHPTWKHAPCPKCGKPAVRETDTMDTFMCSSWYQYRYLSPDYHDGPWDPKQYDYWMPVDVYTGGREHAVMHLIYTRFFTKALRDMGIVRDDEPMTELRNQGVILGEDARKMSKSIGNVVSPDALVSRCGADAVRTYMMFFARWEQGGPWNSKGIEGGVRWLNRVWNLIDSAGPASEAPAEEGDAEAARRMRRATHQTIRRVTEDLESFTFNTAVAALMEFTNMLYKEREKVAGTAAWNESTRSLLLLAAPIAPHITEELWERCGFEYSIHRQSWPEHDPELAAEDMVTLIVQINGKVRDRLTLPADVSREDAEKAALGSEAVRKQAGDREPRKVIYVPGRLVNIVL